MSLRTENKASPEGSEVPRAGRSRAACAGLGVLLLGGCNPGSPPPGEGAPPTAAPVAEDNAKTDAKTDAKTSDAPPPREDHNSAWRDPYALRSAQAGDHAPEVVVEDETGL